MNDILETILNLLRANSKSIAGTLAGLLAGVLVKYDIIITPELHNAIEILLVGIIVGLGVWIAPKNKEVKK